MRKITVPFLVFSSLFFILALFTILMLGLTSFVDEFKAMFFLTTQPFGVYYNIALIFTVCGIIVSIFHIVRIFLSHLPKVYSMVAFFVMLLFIAFLCSELFILSRNHFNPFSLEESLQLQSDIAFTKTLYQAIIDYSFFIAFFMLPAAFLCCNLNINKHSKIGKILYLTQPSFNSMLGILFGFCVMPFLKGGIFSYIDFVLFIAGILAVVYLCVKRKVYLNSYENFDLFLLFVVCIIMLASSFEFVSAESYFEVRKAFYALVLFGWCNAWTSKLKTLR
ncbi:MAG: hypothetical protein SOW25_02780 [Helicobacter sp.]|nr:hypothetical protein [Helicobacteraceae bacterium]MDY3113235.1 hypothetical protein [Helicobacter sp.]